MSAGLGSHNAEGAATTSDTSAAVEFPSEAFACPACGQMLAPSCRVCVACKQPINPAEIRSPEPTPAAAFEPPRLAEPSPTALFSWPLFFKVLLAWLVLAILSQSFLGAVRSQLLLVSLVLVTSAWVFYDARAKAIPKPLRWGVGSLLLWIVVFPWYLARRQNPAAPCRFVEAEVGPLTRALLTVLVIFFLVGLLLMVLKGLGMAS